MNHKNKLDLLYLAIGFILVSCSKPNNKVQIQPFQSYSLNEARQEEALQVPSTQEEVQLLGNSATLNQLILSDSFPLEHLSLSQVLFIIRQNNFRDIVVRPNFPIERLHDNEPLFGIDRGVRIRQLALDDPSVFNRLVRHPRFPFIDLFSSQIHLIHPELIQDIIFNRNFIWRVGNLSLDQVRSLNSATLNRILISHAEICNAYPGDFRYFPVNYLSREQAQSLDVNAYNAAIIQSPSQFPFEYLSNEQMSQIIPSALNQAFQVSHEAQSPFALPDTFVDLWFTQERVASLDNGSDSAVKLENACRHPRFPVHLLSERQVHHLCRRNMARESLCIGLNIATSRPGFPWQYMREYQVYALGFESHLSNGQIAGLVASLQQPPAGNEMGFNLRMLSDAQIQNLSVDELVLLIQFGRDHFPFRRLSLNQFIELQNRNIEFPEDDFGYVERRAEFSD